MSNVFYVLFSSFVKTINVTAERKCFITKTIILIITIKLHVRRRRV